MLTQQKLDAAEAKSLGGVKEIVPAHQLLERAHAIAATIAKQPPLTAKYTRIGLTQRLRRVIDEGIGYGLALEGITAAGVARIAAAQNAA
ncbi:enoyl-CoA hydratase/isomerase family protein [Burkholderia sp. WSM2232]|uniref:enoyl-CoA hydratase/isomerase family protein n=1 Tax=Burkholderia sp. WSM2232 TaxID=944436 RepID=UPI0018DB6985|nr:hypothetical protein [Burkholderia sp. WSM2232]